jgi:hypothetical protein
MVDPTEKKRAFLKEVEVAGGGNRGIGPNWHHVILIRIPINWNSSSNLRKETIDQMQFYHLVLSARREEVLSRKEADAFPVPGYLQGEKESLLIELETCQDPQKAELLKKDFRVRHPDLKWRQESGNRGLFLWR